MQIRNIAALLLRFVGVYLILTGVFGGVEVALLYLKAQAAASAGIETEVGYAAQHELRQLKWTGIGCSISFIIGLHIAIASKRVGKWFCIGLEDDSPNG